MAVYTQVSSDDLTALAAAYDFGEIVRCTGIAEGAENTNYHLQTTTGPFILTLFERRVSPRDLPFFLGLMDHLAVLGVPCPVPLKGRDNEALRTLCGKPAAVVSFLEGAWPRYITVDHCAKLGHALARLHNAGSTYKEDRKNDLSVEGWFDLYENIGDATEMIEPGLTPAIRQHLEAIANAWPAPGADLARGIIHADLFPDNVFFLNEKCSGLIDFYFACTDFLAYDIAICINAWCFDNDGAFNTTKAKSLLSGYQAVRALTDAEKTALPVFAQGAAMRFLLTRLYDWANTPQDAKIKPKDPREYLNILRFHRGIGELSTYGLT